MVTFNPDYMATLIETYIYNKPEGYDPEVMSAVEYLYESYIDDMIHEFPNGEIHKVMNSFQLAVESGEMNQRREAIRGIRSIDAAYLAAHISFMYGLVFAENLRLSFMD